MEIIFKVAKYILNEEDKFIHNGYDEYKITYLKGLKKHELRIVVNGYLTNEKINLVSYRCGYKNKLLAAIREYRKTDLSSVKNWVSKKISLDYIKTNYPINMIWNVENHLLKIKKVESRDKLSEYDLI